MKKQFNKNSTLKAKKKKPSQACSWKQNEIIYLFIKYKTILYKY